MKKSFKMPVMQVSSFDVENIVTASSDTPRETNYELAEQNIAGAKYTTKLAFDDIGLVF